MNKLCIALALALTGCGIGGPEFEVGHQALVEGAPEAAVDGGDEVAAVDGGQDSGVAPHADAGDAQVEAAAESGVGEGGADVVEGGDTGLGDASGKSGSEGGEGGACTPFPTGTQWATSAPCAAAVNVPGAVFQFIDSIPECSGFATPPECRCQETYNCACLAAHGGCGTYAWVDCRQDPGTAPTPTCH